MHMPHMHHDISQTTMHAYLYDPHSNNFETCMPDLPYHLQLDAMHALGKSDPHSYMQ